MAYQILTFGDNLLRRKATPVAGVTDEVRQLAGDMLKAMYAADGVGLAAAQIGRPEALCVIDIPPARDGQDAAARENAHVRMPMVMLNPTILERDGEQVGAEGCLSFPGLQVTVRRAESVTVQFMNLEGQTESARVSGLLARAVQHELDHLDGVLLVDRLSAVQKVAVAGQLRRIKRERNSSAKER